MRRTVSLFPLGLLSLLLSLSAGAAEAAPPSRVDRVILYPDMAEITRVAEVAGAEGEVVLSGLTATLLPETVSAKVIRGSARIAGISVEDVFRPDPAEGRIRELSRLLEELTDGKRAVEGERENLKREKALLESGVSAVFSPAGGKERTRLTVAEIEASLALFRARAKGVDEAILARDRAVREADRKIDAARKELEKIRVPRPTQEKAVHLTLSRPGPCRIDVTYLVSSAGFSPRYDVRLSPTKGTLSFELTGEAWQRTGEEWKGAALTFSTMRPGRMAQLPPLPAWEIDFARPAPVYREMMSRASMGKMASDGANGDEEMDRPASAPSVARRFASMEVTLPDRQDLSGVGERKTFSLARAEQKANVAWRAIPRVADGAFLSADGVNEGGLPILAAPATLFLDDAYVGAGAVKETGEKAPFRVDFGRDEAVQVTRREISRVREDGGVFSKVKRVRFRYEIKVRNSRAEEVHLTVADRVPVPKHQDIVVKDLEITGGGKAGGQGEISWDLRLKPAESTVLGLSFTVEHPADREIHGL
ncbi:MAG TPA: mucoidy inhibitor MuiA family protein [Deferrimonas sp.]|jgi:uncharacterized protein (TIGR02231 family)